MIKTYFLNYQKLPLVIEAQQFNQSLETLKWITSAEMDFFQSELLRCGALLFRGFRVRAPEDFIDFVRDFSGKEFFNYAGGASPRFALEKNIYNSTEYPPDLTLELHNELSYSKNYPRHLYFFCQTAPERGGATSLGDSRRILRQIRPEITDFFKRKKVLYERHLKAEKGSGYSWQEAFETDDHTSALDEETLAWYATAKEKPRLNSFFGDGSPICALTIEHIRDVLRRETVSHEWRTGDILMIDNMLTAHGRMPFSGARRIVLAMT
jgi:alpha-ketoglutarate-dependent taurine dioxygenase